MATQQYNRPSITTYGYASYTGNGATTTYSVPFDFPNKGKVAAASSSPYVKVYVADNEVSYTFTSTANDTIQLSSAPTNGADVEVMREAGLNIVTTWANGSDLNAESLSTVTNRFSWLHQDVITRLKFLGNKVDTISTATAANEYTFTGNASTTDFTLGTETQLGDARYLVFLNGTRQATSAYNIALVGGFATVQFSVAPGAGVAISVLVFNSPILAAGISDGAVTTAKLADGSISFAKLGMNATGVDGQVIVKRSGAWTFGYLTTSEILSFDTNVRLNRLDQMATPTATVNFGAQKIANLNAGTSSGDAVNKGQMDTAITTATTALNIGSIRFKGGAVNVTNTTFGSVSLGFVWDTIILQIEWQNGNVGVRATNTSDTGGSGLNGSIFNPAATFILRRTDITSALRLQVRQNTGAPASNQHELEIQYVSNGFQIRRTGSETQTYTVRYFASSDFTG